MYFDRFDVVEAYYVFAHQGLNCPWEVEQRIDRALFRLRFQPNLRLRNQAYSKHLTENGKAIYMGLIHKYCGINRTAA